MSNGTKMLGIVAAVLVIGAIFSSVYGFGWMGFGHHSMGHSGDRGHSGDGDYCYGGEDECDWMEGNHMMYFENLDISNEDIARIEAIVEDAHMQINEILAGYDIEEMNMDAPSGGSCH